MGIIGSGPSHSIASLAFGMLALMLTTAPGTGAQSHAAAQTQSRAWVNADAQSDASVDASTDADGQPVTILTYNIHHGADAGGELDLEAIARTIEGSGADIVALQEVDRHWSARSENADQAHQLARRLGMHVFYAPIYDLPPSETGAQRRQYGLAILSRYPFIETHNFSITRHSSIEENTAPRMMPGFPKAVVDIGKTHLTLYNTHLDYRDDPAVRRAQVSDMMAHLDDAQTPAVVVGDFNADPSAREMAPLAGRFADAWQVARANDGATYPSGNPTRRLDHIWVSSDVQVHRAAVLGSTASDHRAVLAELSIGETNPGTAAEQSSQTGDWVDDRLAALSLEEKVGQLFIAWASGYYQSVDALGYRRIVSLIDEMKLGGVIFGTGSPLAQATMTNDLQRRSPLPLLIVQDMEWGPGMRLERAVSYPRAMAIGATRNPAYARAAGYATGQAARALGVHQVYGPVADVNNNPANPVINVRSFGEQPGLVADMTSAFVRGIQEGGALATAKHFPGHGDTATDSHIGLPVLPFGRARLDTLELVPFRAAVDAGARSIMTGHLALPQLEPDSTVPATLSPAITRKILREEYGYDGLIVTDAMTMSGVARNFTVGEATVRALEAGADILLKSDDFYEARRAILDAVESGRLTEARIDRSVRRILEAKQWVGLDSDRFVDLPAIRHRVGIRPHHVLASTIARSSLTLLRNEDGLLPIVPPQRPRVLSVTLSDSYDPSDGQEFNSYLRRAADVEELDFARLDVRSDAEEFEAVLERAEDYDVVVVPAFLRVRSGSGKIRLPDEQRTFLNRLIKQDAPVVLVALGNPYMASAISTQPAAYLTTYGAGAAAQQASAEMIFGRSGAEGRLPVTIPGAYAFGEGHSLEQQAPRRDYPEVAGMNSRRLARVDSLMQASITNRAFPGAAVAIGRGQIITHLDGYGYHTYRGETAVTPRSSFDLASLTKVIATTTAAMLLYDEGRLDLDVPVAEYLPAFAQNGKDDVTVRQLLTHRAGLAAYLHPVSNDLHSRQEIVDAIMAQELQYEPGSDSDYSGLGIITLQLIVEKLSGQDFDAYAAEHIFEPLGMDDTGFYRVAHADTARGARAAGTAAARVTKTRTGRARAGAHETHVQAGAEADDLAVPDELKNYIPTSDGTHTFRGIVHDPMARMMGGVSGNAGLFSTAEDLAQFGYMLVNDGRIYGRRFLKPSTIRHFTERANPNGESTRALGWDTKTLDGYSSAGQLFGPKSYGHTGYTGTSFWVDPEQDLYAILLSNRVYPEGGANTRHRPVRPAFGDIVYRSLTGDAAPQIPALPGSDSALRPTPDGPSTDATR